MKNLNTRLDPIGLVEDSIKDQSLKNQHRIEELQVYIKSLEIEIERFSLEFNEARVELENRKQAQIKFEELLDGCK